MNVEHVMQKVAALLATRTKEELLARIKAASSYERDEHGFFEICDSKLLAGYLVSKGADLAFHSPEVWTEAETSENKSVPRQEIEEEAQFLAAADSNELALAA